MRRIVHVDLDGDRDHVQTLVGAAANGAATPNGDHTWIRPIQRPEQMTWVGTECRQFHAVTRRLTNS